MIGALLRRWRGGARWPFASALIVVLASAASAQTSGDQEPPPDDGHPPLSIRPSETPSPPVSKLATAPTAVPADRYAPSEGERHEQTASELLSRAEEAMTTLDYPTSRELAERAMALGGLESDELTRALRLIAVACAQLGDDAAAEPALLRLFALEPDSNIGARLAPERRSAVLDAHGFWSVHKDGFALEVSYARRERQLVVHVRDALGWARNIEVGTRFASRTYVLTRRSVAPELIIAIDEIEPTDALEVYATVSDEHGNVLMRFGRERDPHVFDLTDAELAAILRRDIRGGQVGSYARRLEELDVQVGVHGYASLELKPVGDDVPSFDLHHATAMIRANLHRAASLELAFEWEHLGLDEDDFYLPHAFLDIKVSDLLIIRGGFFEVPVGAFNEYLYPDFLRITGLPPLFAADETAVVPALWSEVGLELRGRVELGGLSRLTYAAFVGNGLEQKDETPDDGVVAEGGNIHDMRFNARDEWKANKAVGGRLGLEVDELDFGISGYTGRYTIEADRDLHMADADISFRGEWLTIRTEGAVAFQEVTGDTLHKYGLYALVAVRPIDYLEPYGEYDFVDVDSPLNRGLLGVAFYPVPHERATRNLRLKSEAGYEFPRGADPKFVWFFQLTTGF